MGEAPLTLPPVGRVGERALQGKASETGWGYVALRTNAADVCLSTPTPLRFADRPSPQGGG